MSSQILPKKLLPTSEFNFWRQTIFTIYHNYYYYYFIIFFFSSKQKKKVSPTGNTKLDLFTNIALRNFIISKDFFVSCLHNFNMCCTCKSFIFVYIIRFLFLKRICKERAAFVLENSHHSMDEYQRTYSYINIWKLESNQIGVYKFYSSSQAPSPRHTQIYLGTYHKRSGYQPWLVSQFTSVVSSTPRGCTSAYTGLSLIW